MAFVGRFEAGSSSKKPRWLFSRSMLPNIRRRLPPTSISSSFSPAGSRSTSDSRGSARLHFELSSAAGSQHCLGFRRHQYSGFRRCFRYGIGEQVIIMMMSSTSHGPHHHHHRFHHRHHLQHYHHHHTQAQPKQQQQKQH